MDNFSRSEELIRLNRLSLVAIGHVDISMAKPLAQLGREATLFRVEESQKEVNLVAEQNVDIPFLRAFANRKLSWDHPVHL